MLLFVVQDPKDEAGGLYVLSKLGGFLYIVSAGGEKPLQEVSSAHKRKRGKTCI